MTDGLKKGVRPAGVRRCPICRQPTEHAYRPFCSRRCSEIDLGRWLGGRYAIPVQEGDHEADAPGLGTDPEDGEVH